MQCKNCGTYYDGRGWKKNCPACESGGIREKLPIRSRIFKKVFMDGRLHDFSELLAFNILTLEELKYLDRNNKLGLIRLPKKLQFGGRVT